MRRTMVFIMLFAFLAVSFTHALPTGPTTQITPIDSERYPTWASQTVTAVAGNVTEFNTDSSTVTRTWQGYFGNITGIIVLGDSNNNTMYDWQLASPQGEIYAVRNDTVPDWYNVRCSSQTELQAEDDALGVNETIDEDAVNRTFVIGGSEEQQTLNGGTITHPLFYVSNVTIEADSCPVVALYNSSRLPSAYFKEVLLSDGGDAPIIYTALVAHTLNPFEESDGFDGATHDFQMIVGENGHGNDLETSTYWFYLELE